MYPGCQRLFLRGFWFQVSIVTRRSGRRLPADPDAINKPLVPRVSRTAHLEKIGQFFQVRHSQSVLIFSILNSLFLFGLSSPLWCFSTLVNYYFETFFTEFEGDFALRKNDLNYLT